MGVARLLVVVLVLLAAGCSEEPAPTGRGPAQPQRARTIVIEGETANDGGTTSITGSAPVEVTASGVTFSPTLLIGPPEQDIEIEVTATGEGTHTFTLPEQGIDEEIPAGSSTLVTATFPDMGTLVFFCTYHRGRGMVGGLTAS